MVNNTLMQYPYNITNIASQQTIMGFVKTINISMGMWPMRFVLSFLWMLIFFVSKKINPSLTLGKQLAAASFSTLLVAILMFFGGLITTTPIIILGIMSGISFFIGEKE